MSSRVLVGVCVGVVLAAGMAACGPADTDPFNPGEDDCDGADDGFVSGGKTDVPGIEEGTPGACAVLRLANEADLETLDYDVKLNSLAAKHIIAFRAGADAAPGTLDDPWFKDLAALDAVKYVGPKAF